MAADSARNAAAFEEFKSQLEAAECATGLLWWSEVRALPRVLKRDERVEELENCEHEGKTWLAVVTNTRLLLVRDPGHGEVALVEDVLHGTTRRLEAKRAHLGDVKLRFSIPGRVLELQVSEDTAPNLYARLRQDGRVPAAEGDDAAVLKKLQSQPQSRLLPAASTLPDPLDYLNRLRRRWILTAIGETGPRRRSFPWAAHLVFDLMGVAAGLIVVAVFAILALALVVVVWYIVTQ
jgi:hypothetical protein